MSAQANLVTSDKITLMLSFIPYLLERGSTPIRDLAEHFEIDPKTARSIVRFFGTAGIPGETATYQHEDLFDIDWDALEQRDEAHLVRTVVVNDHPRFSPREVAALLAGLRFVHALPGVADHVAVTDLMNKLLHTSTQEVTPIQLTGSDVPPPLAQLYRAIESEQSVRFSYRDMDGRLTDRHVIAWRIESDANAWYLRGWCTAREAERLFRIDRMSAIELVPTSGLLSAESSARTQTSSDRMFSPGPDAREVTFTVTRESLSALRRFDIEHSDGFATALLAHPDRAALLASAAPGEIEVLAPAEARQAVADWASRALAQYDA